MIGPAGGTLRSGRDELNIPPSAVTSARTFVLQREPRERIGVRIEASPNVPFENNMSATLTIDFRDCTDLEIGSNPWWVWRMDSTGVSGQKLFTRIAGKRAITRIDSTSAYMIAN
ncbi:MAG: hypothetical protein ACRELT_09845 [Longimicrobiales bacterium]